MALHIHHAAVGHAGLTQRFLIGSFARRRDMASTLDPVEKSSNESEINKFHLGADAGGAEPLRNPTVLQVH